MTIKRRLAVSNVIMIVLPVVITMIIGSLSVGAVYFTLYKTKGFGFENSEDFYRMSLSVTATVNEALEGNEENIPKKLDAVCKALNADTTALVVYKNEQEYYRFGTQMDSDERLISSARLIDGDGFVSSESRQMYRHVLTRKDTVFEVYLFSAPTQMDFKTLKTIIVISAVVIVIGIVFSIYFTNRFLIRFIFKRIENPLDELAHGVHEISTGNLDYRIVYNKNDEFKPICDAFNDMAVRLKRSVEMTRKNEENRKRLLLNISHDLRSPLTSIQVCVEGILDGVASDTQKERKYLEIIKRKAVDIDRMVSQIFEYSKLDAENSQLETELTDLLGETQDIVNAISEEYEKRGLDIFVSGSSAYAMIDTDLYCRIVTNLLDNSAKYKEKDSAHIVIRVEKSQGYAHVIFADDGPGVDESELTKIFDVFYRSDKARINPGNGSGIGLAFVKSAVENMNGSVKAYNNGGLTVEIIFSEANYEQNTDC
ncbi:MAG: ATP-binding protein [Acutalibacteraceae bacterium]